MDSHELQEDEGEEKEGEEKKKKKKTRAAEISLCQDTFCLWGWYQMEIRRESKSLISFPNIKQASTQGHGPQEVSPKIQEKKFSISNLDAWFKGLIETNQPPPHRRRLLWYVISCLHCYRRVDYNHRELFHLQDSLGRDIFRRRTWASYAWLGFRDVAQCLTIDRAVLHKKELSGSKCPCQGKTPSCLIFPQQFPHLFSSAVSLLESHLEGKYFSSR